MDIYYFDKESVETMRESLGLKSTERGYIYEGGLDFALANVKDLHNDLTFEEALIAKSAFLFRSIAKGHFFLGANKRTGLLAMSVFLNYNGLFIQFAHGEGYLKGLAILYNMINEKELRMWIKINIINRSE